MNREISALISGTLRGYHFHLSSESDRCCLGVVQAEPDSNSLCVLNPTWTHAVDVQVLLPLSIKDLKTFPCAVEDLLLLDNLMDNTIYTTHPPSNMYRYHPPAVPPHGGQRYPEQDRPSFNPGYSYRNAAFQGDEPIQPHNQFQRGGSLGPSENTPGDVGNIYQDNVYDNAGGQINSRADQYWNEADRGKQRQDPTADYDDGESVATLDPTEENHLPQAGELRNRFAKRSAGDLWQSVKESRRILAYQGLPSRGTIGRRQNLSQRIKESREAEHDQPLTLTDYTEMIRRWCVVFIQVLQFSWAFVYG